MIPSIGIMIGAYIITRMVSFIMRRGEREERSFVHVLAVLTILITVGIMFSLIGSGLSSG